MIKTFSIRVSGKVQGVFFRASAKQKADELEVKGFVRNDPDESVYIEVQGEEDLVNEFAHWCKVGPKFAKVDRCDVREIEHIHFDTFEVKRS